MKTHLVKTLSITLLLSIPLALQALPGDPYDQRTQVNAQIASIQGEIADLQGQKDAIEPRKRDLTLASSKTKGTNPQLLVQTGQQINDLGLLAVQTSLLIKEKDAAVKAAQDELAKLAVRIKTLEPSGKLPALKKVAKEPSITIETFRKDVLPAITAHQAVDFTNSETYLAKDKNLKDKVAKSDKSAPKLPTSAEYQEIVTARSKTWRATIASGASYIASFVYTAKPATTAEDKK